MFLGMLRERNGIQIKMHCITLEDLVPEEHSLRKLEAAVDFSFIYDEVQDLYVRTTADQASAR